MHTLVIGAGAFGAWAAHHLNTAGVNVTLVDAYGPANARASSGDESRIIRCGYGPDAVYARWARRSLSAWRALFERIGVGHAPLFHGCGVLWLSTGDDPYAEATLGTLRQEQYPIRVLDRESLRAEFPQFAAGDITTGMLESDCGVLMARRAVQALVADLAARGVRVLREHITVPREEGRLTHVRTSDGRDLHADAFVFACGPWLPKVFPTFLAGRIRPTRQVVIYFGVPAGDERFGAEQLPAWIEFPAGIYGVPDLEHRGVKVGLDRHGPPFDPDSSDRMVDEASVETARAWLRKRMPGLASAPVNESRVCQYENTSTGDFLIDRHPAFENVWIAGGGSGHGFKHAPVVGEHVAALARGAAELEPRFTLATKGTEPQRSVY